MRLRFDDDTRSLLETVETYLERRAPVHQGQGDEAAFAAQLWDHGVASGWLGLAVAAEAGGSGAGVVEVGAVLEVLGRRLVPGPWLGSMAAAVVFGRDADAELIASRIARGELMVGVEAEGTADAEGAGGVVFDRGTSNAYLSAADGGSTLRTLPSPAAGDGGFDGAAGRAAAPGAVLASVADCVAGKHVLTLLAAAYASGLAQGALALAVDYAKVREQFGRPIGAFQAVKHRCADMAVRAEAASALAHYALAAAADAIPAARPAAASGFLVAVDAAVRNAEDAVHVHGAMGYTWACPAHLYLRRARAVAGLVSRAEAARTLRGGRGG